jgi:acyl carrier protein
MSVSVDRIRRVLSDNLGVDEEEFKLNADLRDDLSADELDFVEICMALEEEFGIEISDDDVDTWKTFGDIVRYMEGKVKKG